MPDQTPHQPTPVPDSSGQFPPLPTQVAPLLAVIQSRTAMRLTARHADIACFTGEPGTGKTTAVTLAAQQAPGVTWKYFVAPQRATTKGAMLALYEAIFDWNPPANERETTNACVRRLAEGDLGVVVDEVHHVGLLGMQQYRHVWDRATIHHAPFPMVFVGCDVPATLARAAEVRTRIARWVRFDYVQHDEDLLTLTQSLHPRLAATTPATLAQMNNNITEGTIRSWYQLAKHIDDIPSSRTSQTPKKLTGDDIRFLQNLMGTFE